LIEGAPAYTLAEGSITFRVRVAPRASRTCAAGFHDGALKVRVAAPPVEGAANEELRRYLARSFGVTQKDVEITSGLASKTKTVRVRGGTPERLALLAAG
jgi:uncharacterized protein (TIGR00251 family)